MCILVKVCYYIFDVVVLSYLNIGENFWVEVWVMILLNLIVKVGGDGIINEDYENNLVKFKNVDVIGYFGGYVFS